MAEWEIKEHPDFFKDLDKLSTSDLTIFYHKKKKIKENPEREKHLSGGVNCYREPITRNIRLVYYIKGNVIWLLTAGKHKEAYKAHLKRLYSLRERLDMSEIATRPLHASTRSKRAISEHVSEMRGISEYAQKPMFLTLKNTPRPLGRGFLTEAQQETIDAIREMLPAFRELMKKKLGLT